MSNIFFSTTRLKQILQLLNEENQNRVLLSSSVLAAEAVAVGETIEQKIRKLAAPKKKSQKINEEVKWVTVVLQGTKHGWPQSKKKRGANAGREEEDCARLAVLSSRVLFHKVRVGAGRRVYPREAPSRRRRRAVYSSAGETSWICREHDDKTKVCGGKGAGADAGRKNGSSSGATRTASG